mmetsp:Transcript_12565/g.50267  ORF Transcript_12565/g.50267 Transcript_12565/m.50267 type:complete len:214 (-) Transcript_12565:10-651(-)
MIHNPVPGHSQQLCAGSEEAEHVLGDHRRDHGGDGVEEVAIGEAEEAELVYVLVQVGADDRQQLCGRLQLLLPHLGQEVLHRVAVQVKRRVKLDFVEMVHHHRLGRSVVRVPHPRQHHEADAQHNDEVEDRCQRRRAQRAGRPLHNHRTLRSLRDDVDLLERVRGKHHDACCDRQQRQGAARGNADHGRLQGVSAAVEAVVHVHPGAQVVRGR